jgi:hypothetical protein
MPLVEPVVFEVEPAQTASTWPVMRESLKKTAFHFAARINAQGRFP